MKRNLKLSRSESAGLRSRLEDHLAEIFTSKAISKYLTMDENSSQLYIVDTCQDNSLAFPQTKLAYATWSGMYAADRHAVLGKFYILYVGTSFTNACNRKTLTFCTLFVHEFAAILAEATEWPD